MNLTKLSGRVGNRDKTRTIERSKDENKKPGCRWVRQPGYPRLWKWDSEKKGPVALRPRLSAGLPLTMGLHTVVTEKRWEELSFSYIPHSLAVCKRGNGFA